FDLHPDAPEPAGRQGHRRAGHDRRHAVRGLGRARRAAARGSDSPGHAAHAAARVGRALAGREMIPQDFEYFAPRSLREALDLLARNADAKALGGGMSLIPALKHRLQTPAALVDLGRLPDLEAVAEKRGALVIGGRATHAALAASAELAALHAVREAAAAIGDVQVRNRGTIGGSLVHADPAADWPAVFLAFDGEATVAS